MNSRDKIENKRTGQQMIFLQTAKDTNGALLQIECFSPPTTMREPEHIHPSQENSFRVLSGVLHFRINGKIFLAGPDDEISIPAGTPHYFWNEEQETAHYIQEFRPALEIEDLFQTFFSLSRQGKLNRSGVPNIFQASLIMLRYSKELRIVRPSWTLQKIVFSCFAPIGKLLKLKAHYP
jgi:mannose-6-phosphate isomerase-like protein (cupin superfamily)